MALQSTGLKSWRSGRKPLRSWANLNFGNDSFDASFAKTLQTEVTRAQSHSLNLDGITPRGELDGPIELEEVQDALDNLKRGKACGIDGVVNEILKFGGEVMEEAVWRLCQVMFSSEKIPVEWSRGVIFPL